MIRLEMKVVLFDSARSFCSLVLMFVVPTVNSNCGCMGAFFFFFSSSVFLPVFQQRKNSFRDMT